MKSLFDDAATRRDTAKKQELEKVAFYEYVPTSVYMRQLCMSTYACSMRMRVFVLVYMYASAWTMLLATCICIVLRNSPPTHFFVENM
jgi:hypothetical protein